MKVLKLLRKEYPELNLALGWDKNNDFLVFTGHATPTELIKKGVIKDFYINGINMYVSSLNSPEVRYNSTTNKLKSIGLYIGGDSQNNLIFKVNKFTSKQLDLKQLFKITQLNKQIKIL